MAGGLFGVLFASPFGLGGFILRDDALKQVAKISPPFALSEGKGSCRENQQGSKAGESGV
ncbi:MAG: hypothetical protein R3F11_17435 [Verrucomicrobiales bacterium]